MSTQNLQINAINYSDINPSNNPQIRNWDLGFKILGQPTGNARSDALSLAPGETRSIFNGTRTTAIDGSTAFTVSQPYPSLPNLYRFTNTAGTAPVFRTNRLPGVDNTSQFSVSVNGPLSTYTNTAGTALNTTNVVVGDILRIDVGAGFNPANQGDFVILAKTSSSVTVENLNAVIENITLVDFTQFLIYSNGGGNSNQIQIGDKVIISAGFSLATLGTYVIQEVTPSYFQIQAAVPNGLPIESNIIPGVAGLVFYSAAKQFVLVAAQQKCSVQNNADVSDNSILEPIQLNNPQKPAIYIKQGTTYSLSIHNLSLETLNVIIASAE